MTTMRCLTTTVVALLLFALQAQAQQQDIPSDVILFKNVKVFNGTDDKLNDVDVLVVADPDLPRMEEAAKRGPLLRSCLAQRWSMEVGSQNYRAGPGPDAPVPGHRARALDRPRRRSRFWPPWIWEMAA